MVIKFKAFHDYQELEEPHAGKYLLLVAGVINVPGDQNLAHCWLNPTEYMCTVQQCLRRIQQLKRLALLKRTCRILLENQPSPRFKTSWIFLCVLHWLRYCSLNSFSAKDQWDSITTSCYWQRLWAWSALLWGFLSQTTMISMWKNLQHTQFFRIAHRLSFNWLPCLPYTNLQQHTLEEPCHWLPSCVLLVSPGP